MKGEEKGQEVKLQNFVRHLIGHCGVEEFSEVIYVLLICVGHSDISETCGGNFIFLVGRSSVGGRLCFWPHCALCCWLEYLGSA